VSFILDALRKSEHERQRSATPGLAQVPSAIPEPQLPRWALSVIGLLAASLVALTAAWWQSSRMPGGSSASFAPTVERSVELPPPRAFPQGAAPQRAAPVPPAAGRSSAEPSLAAAAAAAATESDTPASEPSRLDLPVDAPALRASRLDLPADAAALPSAAALLAEGVVLPPLRLELHAYSEQPRARFVYINGRKYTEGERIAEGPQVVSIVPTGAVLAHAGRRFVLVQE
jgi:general secretion pathway protein B